LSEPDDRLLSFCRGDADLQRILRGSLEVLRDRAEDPELRRYADDVLTGRASVRDLGTSDALDRAVTPHLESLAQVHAEAEAERARSGDDRGTAGGRTGD
jgi:hypothetical protein